VALPTIATVVSEAAGGGAAALEHAYQELCEQLGGAPSWSLLCLSATHDLDAIREAWSRSAEGPLHGATSSGGVMTQRGMHPGGLGLFGIRDPQGAYGTRAPLGDDAAQAAQQALLGALEQAGRAGELPALLWLSCPPGVEERAIAGLQAVVGSGVAIAGGTAADDDIAGGWRLFDRDILGADVVVVSVLFPSMRHAMLFQSGFEPTTKRATVTGAEGRLLRTLDGRPAAEVYDAFTGGAIQPQCAAGEGTILGETSLFPLGRVVGDVHGTPYHLLSHPASVEAGGALALFTDVEVGDEVVLMRGSAERLVKRAGRLTEQAVALHDVAPERLLGGLVVYCAGCMMNVSERLDEVVAGIDQGMGHKPFLGTFTFGEQGCFVGGESRHGNLMITVLVFFEASGSG
jgi:hypothetical protein